MKNLDNKADENSYRQPENETGYNRKNVDRIKRFIIIGMLMVCALPVIGCIYLFGRLTDMDKQVEDLENQVELSDTSSDDVSSGSEGGKDILDRENSAKDDIEKNTREDSNILSSADKEQNDETTEISGTMQGHKLNGKKVYLTFDDGPSIYTDEILDILKEKGVKATFFVVYNDDKELWEKYNHIVEQGHTLGMHSYSHVYDKVYNSLDSFKEDVTGIHDFLLEQTGVDCKFYRFPGGSSNTVSNVDIQVLIKYLNQQGYTYFDWNSLSGDAVNKYMSPEELNANVMKYVLANQGDSVVLMHDLTNIHATVEALPQLIDILIQEGYEICPIDDNTKPVQHVTYEED